MTIHAHSMHLNRLHILLRVASKHAVTQQHNHKPNKDSTRWIVEDFVIVSNIGLESWDIHLIVFKGLSVGMMTTMANMERGGMSGEQGEQSHQPTGNH